MPTHDANGRPIRELHGVKLADILEYLVANVGFPALAEKIPIRCFAYDPSISSSLVFLRRTPWARAKVEALYVELRLAE
ncbi:MAG: VF530 family protein [Polyangiaceae bacterium]